MSFRSRQRSLPLRLPAVQRYPVHGFLFSDPGLPQSPLVPEPKEGMTHRPLQSRSSHSSDPLPSLRPFRRAAPRRRLVLRKYSLQKDATQFPAPAVGAALLSPGNDLGLRDEP